MYTQEIKILLLKALNLKKVYVLVEENHYKIIAIDKIFIGKSTIEQHKLIYGPIAKYITNNKIHSISIHVFCPEEWNKNTNYNKNIIGLLS